LGDHIKTSFEMADLTRVYELSKEVNNSLIIQKNLDPTSGLVAADSSTSAGYILVPTAGVGEYEDIHNFFKNVFDSVAIQKENARLAIYNGTWDTWHYTNLYDELESGGYNIVDDGGADARNYSVTKLIDYSNGVLCGYQRVSIMLIIQ
ncbi:MAG: hypothetical protein U9O95_07160, partial [Candidatus Marinimicrobia bacterium]|nr:hypothetical protein [Candidatus Neomarinimicrobiota bacterium]